MAINEFHDLAELQLNINPSTQTIESSWGNLGYWAEDGCQDKLQYSQACTQLAMEVAHMANLENMESDHTLLDTGFGCGDQLMVWLNIFNVKNIYGLNISQSQTQLAQDTLASAELSINTCKISVSDCCLKTSWQTLDHNFQRIVALDCIYHFSDKPQYFSLCEEHLASDGVLVVSDLLLATSDLSWWHKFLLKTICFVSHIPFGNFKSFAQYQDQLAQSGLTITQHKDISQQVFLPFGEWLNQYIPQIKNNPNLPKNTSWLKYKGTAKFLAWGYKNKVFRYYILRIEGLNSAGTKKVSAETCLKSMEAEGNQ